MEKTFKTLVLSSFILFVIWWHFGYLDPFLTDDPDTLWFWNSVGFDAKFDFPGWYTHLWFAFWVVAYGGLFFLYRPMRSVFVIGYLLSYVTAPFHGSVIESPWSNIVGDLGTLLDGAILGLAYFSSVAKNFGREKAER